MGRRHMRTEGERMREFVAYVRMLAAQRQAMGATVEQFVNDLDLMATGKPKGSRIEGGDPATD